MLIDQIMITFSILALITHMILSSTMSNKRQHCKDKASFMTDKSIRRGLNRYGNSTQNQDAGGFFSIHNGQFTVLWVADGHGEFGNFVSSLIGSKIEAVFAEQLGRDATLGANGSQLMRTCIRELASIVETEWSDNDRKYYMESGCTLAIAIVNHETNMCTYGSVGDSWCKLYDKEGRNILASDTQIHKATNEEEKARILALNKERDEARNVPFNERMYIRGSRFLGDHMLTRALGNGRFVPYGMSTEPHIMSFQIKDGAILMLCTDGADKVDTDSIVLKSLESTSKTDLAEKIVRAANLNDDVTAVTYHF